MGATFAMYTCVKMDATLPSIVNNIKLLIIFYFFLFFETYLAILF